MWWLLPLLALAFTIAAWPLGPSPGGFAAAAIAGLQLAGWAFERRSGLTRAVLPTDAPYWLDRAATAGVLVVGVVAAAVAVAGMVGTMQRPLRRA